MHFSPQSPHSATIHGFLLLLLLPLATRHVHAGFVTRQGTNLMLNGKRFAFASTNDYRLGTLPSEMSLQLLSHIRKLGFNVVRTWLFNEAPLNQTDPAACMQRYNPATGMNELCEQGMQKVDFVLAEAAKLGMKVVFTLADNWNYYGGADMYVKWFQQRDPNLQYHNQFFSEPMLKDAYKRYVGNVLNRTNTLTGIRYADDPTVLMWELINEPRCQGNELPTQQELCAGPLRMNSTAPKPTVIRNWAQEMAQFVKSVDPNHLLALGDDGFFAWEGPKYDWDARYSGYYGVDWDDILAIRELDVATLHLYLDTTNDTELVEKGTLWICDHAKVARSYQKPVILGEYFPQKAENHLGVIGAWMQAMESERYSGSLVWMMSCNNDQNNFNSFIISCQDNQFTAMLRQHQDRLQ